MLLAKSSRITIKHRIFLTADTTYLSLSLVHGKLLLLHSLQLRADAELGRLEYQKLKMFQSFDKF